MIRPKLTARGDPNHDHVVAGIVARLIDLPRQAVVLAEAETHLNLLPHVRASWTLRTARPQIPTPGTNRQVTVFGAIEVTTGIPTPRSPGLRGRGPCPARQAGLDLVHPRPRQRAADGARPGVGAAWWRR